MLTIKQRQLNLKTYMYYYKGDIDGKEGNLTKEAYMKFQSNNCLKVDGIYGLNTDKKLILCIKDIQNLLNKFGYNLINDGIVGDLTINAIKDFQRKNNLTIDGIVGIKTFEKLGNHINNTLAWNNIKYFKKSEFTCKCGCNLNNIDINLVKILDEIRTHFNKPVIITSGTRCTKHNKNVGGKSYSRHLIGKAADFVVLGVNQNIVYEYTRKLVSSSKLRYTYTGTKDMGNAIHIDIN